MTTHPPLPSEFCDRIRDQFPEDCDELIGSLDRIPVASVHLHPHKSADPFPDQTAVPWMNRGRILHERPVFTLDPFYHSGAYYPQESSSMFVHWVAAHTIGTNSNARVLDLCAAPGGKSILLSTLLGDHGQLWANEINSSRNAVLRENLTRWGSTSFIVTRNESDQFREFHLQFDLILVDAPCSGEGMFRKDPSSRSEWSESHVKSCGRKQNSILEDIMPCVAPGGYLIYSTCTFSEEENQQQCERIMTDNEWECVQVPLPEKSNIIEIKAPSFTGYQFLPHLIPGEGFFCAVFRKKGEVMPSSLRKQSVRNPYWRDPKENELRKLSGWVPDSTRHLITNDAGQYFLSALSPQELNETSKQLYITLPGISVGRFVREEFIPDHPLAMLYPLNPLVKRIELSLESALEYLRGGVILIPQASMGWCVVCYKDLPLGWVKVLPNRINNYLPKELRIRMKARQ